MENLTLKRREYLSEGLLTESSGQGKKGITFTGSHPSGGMDAYLDHTTLFTLRHPMHNKDAEAMKSNMNRMLCLILWLLWFLLFGTVVALLILV